MEAAFDVVKSCSVAQMVLKLKVNVIFHVINICMRDKFLFANLAALSGPIYTQGMLTPAFALTLSLTPH